MGDDKKRKRSSRIISMDGLDLVLTSVFFPSKRTIRKASSTTTSDDVKFIDLLKHASKVSKEQLGRIDDAFRLSWREVYDICCMFRSNKWPTPKEFFEWDLYTKAFYLKMLTCCENKPFLWYKSLKRQEGAISEYIPPIEVSSKVWGDSFSVLWLKKPLKFGCYSPGTLPERIPYHLYLLVKEAVDIMKHDEWYINNNLQTDLLRVEKKIRFFCYYFHSHLPIGWTYNREDASTDIADYDPTRKPKYDMSGYIPFSSFEGPNVGLECDAKTYLSLSEMLAVMCVIHSRETPAIWTMGKHAALFYCKICSCFGIDYHRLETASEDDVCLMNVGLHYPS